MQLIRFPRLVPVLAVLFICSCAKPPLRPVSRTHLPPENLPQVGSTRPPAASPSAPRPARPAVVDAMISKAEQQLKQDRPEAAFRTLERALAVDGRDPLIWHLMAKARLNQGQYAQAKSLAGKSNTLAGDDGDLREKNRRIISQAKEGLSRI
ncbi:MAG: tetratricopeptide repeat protein [Desulfobacter sp.]|nr:MAG: tetratricopeptide repeat protein [Desulfobacter sp.]